MAHPLHSLKKHEFLRLRKRRRKYVGMSERLYQRQENIFHVEELTAQTCKTVEISKVQQGRWGLEE